MRRVFVTIFLWFLMTAIGAGAVFVLTGLYSSDGMVGRKWQVLTDETMTLHGIEAAEAYQRGGTVALDGSLARLEKTFMVDTALYDSDAHLLLSRRYLPDTLSPVRRTLQTGRAQSSLLFNRTFCTHLVVTANGQRYVLVVALRGSPLSHVYSPILRGLLTLTFVGLVCYIGAVSLARPIEQLRRATRELGAGDFSLRIGSTLGRRRDELGGLARDFDSMASTIQRLLTARQRLLQDVSHELRSPLARLGVALELLRAQQESSRAEFALNRMEKDLRRMDELIGEILTLARMEDERMREARMFYGPVDVMALLTSIVADANFHALQEEKQVILQSASLPVISANPELLRRAYENVVLNAVRYTPPGSSVEVTAAPAPGIEGTKIAVTVRDYGAGVPEEELATIFQPFYRVAKDRDRQSGGYGLGLAIVHQAVRLHAGTVCATLANPGLRITLEIPIS